MLKCSALDRSSGLCFVEVLCFTAGSDSLRNSRNDFIHLLLLRLYLRVLNDVSQLKREIIQYIGPCRRKRGVMY